MEATTQVQPCENCGTLDTDDEDRDRYRAARVGSKAREGGWRFERLCAPCAKQMPLTTGGGRWGEEES